MPNMTLAQYVQILDNWLEFQQVQGFNSGDPLTDAFGRMIVKDIEIIREHAFTMLHLGDDDIYIDKKEPHGEKNEDHTDNER